MKLLRKLIKLFTFFIISTFFFTNNTFASESLKNEQEIIIEMYNCLLQQKQIKIRYAGKAFKQLDLDTIHDYFRKAFSIDKDTIRDNAAMWANIKEYKLSVGKYSTYALICIEIDYRHDLKQMEDLSNVINTMIVSLNSQYHFNEMKDDEIIKVVHDYLCEKFDYDYTLHNDDYDAIFSKENVMVCQGYALLAYKILNGLGVETKIIISKSHAWNIVKLNDEWYHIDITNDDLGEKIVYDYFLKANLKEKAYQYFSETMYYNLKEDNLKFAEKDYFITDNNQKLIHSLNRSYNVFINTYFLVDNFNVPIFFIVIIVFANKILYTFLKRHSKNIRDKKNKRFEFYNSL